MNEATGDWNDIESSSSLKWPYICQSKEPMRCDPKNNHWSCCSDTTPCGVGEGDCDRDSHCAGDLRCGKDNCPAGHENMDCCQSKGVTSLTGPQLTVRNGNWGSWGGWSTCTKSCGRGVRSKTRKCNNPAPSNGGQNCPGSSSSSLTCNTQSCPGFIFTKKNIFKDLI